MTKVSILEDALGNYSSLGSEILFHCPFCNHHKKKLSINLSKGYYKCWVCEKKGKIAFLLKKYPIQYRQWLETTNTVEQLATTDLREMFFDKEEKKKDDCVDLRLPKEFISLVGNNSKASSFARRYLSDRGIEEGDINKWKMGYCVGGEYGGRIIVPSFSEKGCLNYYVARTYVGDYVKYKNPPESKDIVFNELFIDFNMPITLTEGVFDAVKAGTNAIPILGSFFSMESRLFEKLTNSKQKVYLALDPDAREKENKIMKMLLMAGLEVAKVRVATYADVGEMSKEEFQKRKALADDISTRQMFGRTMKERLEMC